MRWRSIDVGSILGGEHDAVRYEVLQYLGGGNFGEVFKVRDVQLGTFCALKTIHHKYQNMSNSDLVLLIQHFEQEARVWISLPVHENLVRASAFFLFHDQGDRPFLQMEFVGGSSLAKILQQQGRRLAPAQVVTYAMGICRGMKNACDIERPDHVVIHRDISPDNVLVSSYHNTPKVTDFGLARMEDEKTVGSIAGKWLYMAPEVLVRGGWRGDSGSARVDRRADIYSLAVTLYQMLTGEFPIDVRRAGQGAILDTAPRDIREVLPRHGAGVPADLLDLVMGCLKKDPNARIAQTWDALLEQLQELAEAVDAASDHKVCSGCGFCSRNEAQMAQCEVCGKRQFMSKPAGVKSAAAATAGSPKVQQEVVADPVFLRVPGGRSVLGANMTLLIGVRAQARSDGIDLNVLAEPKARAAELPPFDITQAPITEGQFARFEQQTDYCSSRSAHHGSARARIPVTGITFGDAEAFCDWAGGRLPSADEWEKAARGLDGRAYPWGSRFDPAKCTCRESGAAGPVAVDSHPDARSPFGLLECVGNVGEFVDAGRQGRKYVLGGGFQDSCRYYGLLWARLSLARSDKGDPRVGFRMAKDVDSLGPFESRFVTIEGQAVVGCDPSLITELECRIPLHDSVLQGLRKDQQRLVTLEPYEIGVYPVTNEEYWLFVTQAGYDLPQQWREQPYKWTNRPFLQKYKYHPIVNVTHDDALAYCRWLRKKDRGYTYRLPTREEWQAAARGSQPRVYPWGDEFESALCNGGESSWQRTTDAREYPGGDSPHGCRQMTGNVFEWLAHRDGRARYMRGGSFESACELYGMTFFEMESNDRSKFPATGFRLVRQRRDSAIANSAGKHLE